MIPGSGTGRPARPRHMPDPSPVSTDAIDALIQRCLGGDQTAWEDIVRQHRRKVFNIAYKFTGRHDEAEDLTQDVFLKIFKSLHTFDRRANFQTWLVSVSRNLCIDHYRSVRKERETIDRDVDAGELTPSAPGQNAYQALEQRDRVELLRKAMAELPPTLRDGGDAARHPGAVVSGNRRSAAAAGRHREISHQSRPHRTGAPGAAAARRRRKGTGMNLTTDRSQGIAIVRIGETRMMYPLLADFSGAVMSLLAGRRQEGADRPVEGHLRRLGHHRLPDGSVSPDARRPAASCGWPASTSASRPC